jgi:hypothetical protein
VGGRKGAVLQCRLVTRCHKQHLTWTDSVDKRRKWRKLDVKFCTWNVRSLHSAGSLMTAAEKISKYRLDLVGVEEA